MTVDQEKAKKAYLLLEELLTILEEGGEENWFRGIKAASQELVDSSGFVAEAKFDDARSIYNTMTAGGRGFSEFFFWNDDEDKRISIIRKLDNLRRQIWKTFNE